MYTNAFLVVRTVVFALLTYLHVLIFIFASWNIVTAKSLGMSAPGATVLLLIMSVFIFMFVPVAYLAELICPKSRPAYVRVECAWTTLMSTLQLAASVAVTVAGPPIYCQTHSPWAMCASSSLLAHINWLATFITLSYCLTLCLASATHAVLLPDIWTTPIPHVPWFRVDAQASAPILVSHIPTQKRHPKTTFSSRSVRESSCAVSRYIAERWEKLSRTERQPVSSGPASFARGRQSADPARPTWASQHRIRRGVDDPFAKPLPKCEEKPFVLMPPPRTRSKQTATSTLRGSNSEEVNERSETMWTRSCSTLSESPRTSSMFPRKPANPDLPIPHSRRSEWVRADALSWITIHSNPLR